MHPREKTYCAHTGPACDPCYYEVSRYEAAIAREEALSYGSGVFPPKTPAWAKKPMHAVPLSPETRKHLREQKKIQDHEAKRRELEGPLVELPAIVLRDGTVAHLPLEHFTAVITPYLGALCLDVENTGYQLGHVHYALRTVQLGGEHLAVVLDADDPVQLGLVRWALWAAQRLHAFSASADLVPCVSAGLVSWDEAWSKMRDGVNYAKLTDPAMTGSDAEGLKDLSRALLGSYSVSKAADEARSKLFTFMKTLTKTTVLTPVERSGWAQVNKFCSTMIRYAGSDVLDLGAVVRVLSQKLPVSEDVLDRECQVQAVTSRIAYDGFPLDLPHIKEKIAEYKRRQYDARVMVEYLTAGEITNPSSSDQVLPCLQALGYVLKPDRKTKQPSAGKASLKPYANRTDDPKHLLAKYILEYRHCTTTLGLLLRQLENLCEQGDARMRPTVYTLEARTGRFSAVRPNGMQFCYTSDMDILTDQGWKAFPDVDGAERVAQWSAGLIEFVTPEAVLHQSYSGPMVKISGEHHEQVVTPAHRVYSKTRDGKLMIESAESWLKHGAADKIVDRKFIRGGRLSGRKLTDAERLSLYRAVAVQADGHFRDDCDFVSIKVTKARKVQRARELGLSVRETPNTAGGKAIFEAKAYETDCAPWLVMPSKTFSIPALLELDSEELAGFLHEIMIWDGDSSRKTVYNQAEVRSAAVEAVELAALLSGNSTCRAKFTVAGHLYDRVQVFPKAERHASRTNVEVVPSDGMIHCVTVPSGAVVVRCNGKVIVSGNSRQGGIRACVKAGEMYLELVDGKWEVAH